MSNAGQSSAAIKYDLLDLAPDITRVLMIEDNFADYYLARKELNKLSGLNSLYIANVSTLKDALSIIAITPFDIIILDLNLPDTNGAEGAYCVKSALSHNIPLIVFSGIYYELAREDYLIHGATHFVAKGPAGIFELKALVKKLIDAQLSPPW